MGKNEGEQDWDYMTRVAPWVHDAFGRIPRWNEATSALFGVPQTIWEGNNQVDLTNKTLIGLLQLEVEGLAARLQRNEELMQELATRMLKLEEAIEGLKAGKEWRLLLRARNSLVYQSPLGELAAVPLALADILVHGRPYEGTIGAHGKFLRFSVGKDVIAELPRSLIVQLRGFGPGVEDKEVEDGSGEGGEG